MAEALWRLSRPRELAFLPWSSELAAGWMAGLQPAVRDASMHLKLPNGALVSGECVLAATLAHVRGLKWVAGVSHRVPPLARLLSWTYRFVAEHREFLSRLVPYRPPVIRRPEIR